MEYNFGEYHKKSEQREREVSQDEKQQLFLLAGNILLAGNSETHYAPEPGKTYLDSNGFPAKFRVLEMLVKDDKWQVLKQIGVTQATLYYWSERSCEGVNFPDQVNLEVGWSDNKPSDLFTMKLVSDDGDETYRVMLGNRIEMQQSGVEWLEASRQDVDVVSTVLDKAKEVLGRGLATS